jgi:methylenetetrahydrofolate reductase (NADPH)
MHIDDIFAKGRPTVSYEFYPPKTDEEMGELFAVIAELEPLRPSFVSVTYGAGGGTRQRTHDLVARIQSETSCDPVPHLTCVMHTAAEIDEILLRYAALGISNINALGGDPPRTVAGYDRSSDAFRYGRDLVAYIAQFNASGRHPDPRGFGIGVGGYPEGHHLTPNRLLEMDYLKAKVDAGANFITTQLFFDNHDFFDFRDRCRLAGIDVPILAGLMPVTSVQGMNRMAELSLGSRFPAGLLRSIARCEGDRKAVRRVGVQWATEQCRALLDNGVDGLHFYTLNKSSATREVYANLGAKTTQSLAVANGRAIIDIEERV